MSERSELGVVYTEHADLRATPVASVWSYETQTRGRHRRPVERDPIGNYVYWLEPSDPLLKQFARRFSTSTGMTPKMFARVTRFQSLIHALLSTDVSEWASVAAGVGFYDQSHMINEVREFAGASPTVFFQPHGDTADAPNRQRRGRPSEWQSVK